MANSQVMETAENFFLSVRTVLDGKVANNIAIQKLHLVQRQKPWQTLIR